MKLRVMTDVDTGKASYWMWCPGCDDTVRITSEWDWDGNLDAPTFSPSILTTGVQWAESEHFYKPNHASVPAGGEIRCHSFLRAAVWEFLTDCTHALAGQHVPMVDLPDWLSGESL